MTLAVNWKALAAGEGVSVGGGRVEVAVGGFWVGLGVGGCRVGAAVLAGVGTAVGGGGVWPGSGITSVCPVMMRLGSASPLASAMARMVTPYSMASSHNVSPRLTLWAIDSAEGVVVGGTGVPVGSGVPVAGGGVSVTAISAVVVGIAVASTSTAMVLTGVGVSGAGVFVGRGVLVGRTIQARGVGSTLSNVGCGVRVG
jgi:hypothetical protein